MFVRSIRAKIKEHMIRETLVRFPDKPFRHRCWYLETAAAAGRGSLMVFNAFCLCHLLDATCSLQCKSRMV